MTPTALNQQLRAELPFMCDRARPAALRYVRGQVRNPERAEELVQEALAKAVEKFDTFQGSDGRTFTSWVIGFARNLVLNYRRRSAELLTEDGVLDAKDDQVGALRDLQREERQELIRRAAVEELDELEQDVVHMRYVEGMSRAQIAEECGLADASAVRAVIARSMNRLRKGLRLRLQELSEGTSFLRTTW